MGTRRSFSRRQLSNESKRSTWTLSNSVGTTISGRDVEKLLLNLGGGGPGPGAMHCTALDGQAGGGVEPEGWSNGADLSTGDDWPGPLTKAGPGMGVKGGGPGRGPGCGRCIAFVELGASGCLSRICNGTAGALPQDSNISDASCAPQVRRGGRGIGCGGNGHRINFHRFWVKEVRQTGTMARHKTQTGQKCRDNRSPFKSTVRKGYHCPCSMIMT